MGSGFGISRAQGFKSICSKGHTQLRFQMSFCLRLMPPKTQTVLHPHLLLLLVVVVVVVVIIIRAINF